MAFTELLMSESSPQCPLKVIRKVQSLENYSFTNCDLRCFPGGLVVKNLSVQEMQIQSLGWEDSLEKEKATHSSILAWEIPKDRGAWQATFHRVAKTWTRLGD